MKSIWPRPSFLWLICTGLWGGHGPLGTPWIHYWLGGVCYWGGICYWGVSASRGVCYQRGVCKWGVSTTGGECLLPGDVCYQGGVYYKGGVCYWGYLLPGGCVWFWGVSATGGVCYWGGVSAQREFPLCTEFLTHATENITLATISFEFLCFGHLCSRTQLCTKPQETELPRSWRLIVSLTLSGTLDASVDHLRGSSSQVALVEQRSIQKPEQPEIWDKIVGPFVVCKEMEKLQLNLWTKVT